jgi:hypothetical protein
MPKEMKLLSGEVKTYTDLDTMISEIRSYSSDFASMYDGFIEIDDNAKKLLIGFISTIDNSKWQIKITNVIRSSGDSRKFGCCFMTLERKRLLCKYLMHKMTFDDVLKQIKAFPPTVKHQAIARLRRLRAEQNY